MAKQSIPASEKSNAVQLMLAAAHAADEMSKDTGRVGPLESSRTHPSASTIVSPNFSARDRYPHDERRVLQPAADNAEPLPFQHWQPANAALVDLHLLTEEKEHETGQRC